VRGPGVRLEVIGRRDRLSPSLCAAISRVEAATARGAKLWLRIAVDYSAARRDSFGRRVAWRTFVGHSGKRIWDRPWICSSAPERADGSAISCYGVCLRGAGVLADHVARFRRRRSGCGRSGIQGKGTKIRRSARSARAAEGAWLD